MTGKREIKAYSNKAEKIMSRCQVDLIKRVQKAKRELQQLIDAVSVKESLIILRNARRPKIRRKHVNQEKASK